MDKNKLRVLIIAGVMGFTAILLIPIYLQQEVRKRVASLTPVHPSIEETSVLLATRDIPRGQTVEKTSVLTKKFPVNFIQPGALTSAEPALGKTAVVDILSGEQVTASKLAESKAALETTMPPSSLAMVTPPGKRAITVQIDPLMAVGGMVKPGDYVDVLANFPVPQEGQAGAQLVTVTLFQNVLVLAVGTQLKDIAQTLHSRSTRQESSAVSPQAQTITLALSPQEAELISFAEQQGKLKLILRPPLDTQIHPLPVASAEALWQYILSMQGINISQTTEQPATEQKSSSTVEVYRAGKK